jgi:dihydroorotate dehydrogenase (fumarate)
MIDLSTTYLGLPLSSPLVPSASPLAQDLDNIRRLEDAGASAIVLHSLFEEPPQSGSTYVPARPALDHYLSHLYKAKDATNLPIFASLCAATPTGWTDYARQLEQAGADALELNLYQVPSQVDIPGSALEDTYIQTLRDVKAAVKVPVAAKLTPFFTSMANMAKRFDEAGANALVLFNRFYQPDVNLEALEIQPNVLLSTAQALRLPLTWIGILFGRVKANLAGSGGVHTADDVVKLLLAGADVTMVCSALLRNGITHLRELESGLRDWLERHECASVGAIKGTLSQIRCPDPAAFERAQYVNAVKGMQNVVVTGREAWRILSGQ